LDLGDQAMAMRGENIDLSGLTSVGGVPNWLSVSWHPVVGLGQTFWMARVEPLPESWRLTIRSSFSS
jgi:hypothetical protein